MKKLLLAITGIAFLSSCQKEYVCTCVFPNDKSKPTTRTPVLSKKWADAMQKCDVMNTETNKIGGFCSISNTN